MNSGEMKPLAMFGADSTNSQTSTNTGVTRTVSDVSYTGALGGLLDLVAGRMGVSWKYEEGNVVFYYLETKRFDIQPADAKYDLTGTVTSGLSNATGTDSGNGGEHPAPVFLVQAVQRCPPQ